MSATLQDAQARALDGQWLDHKTLLTLQMHVLDAREQQIEFVRAARQVENGVEVRVLHTVRTEGPGRLAVLGTGPEAIEFSAVVPGGSIRPVEES